LAFRRPEFAPSLWSDRIPFHDRIHLRCFGTEPARDNA
jgi:hypothetical protein